MSKLGAFIQPLFRIAGYELRPVTSPPALGVFRAFWHQSLKETYGDITEREWEVYLKVREFTLLSLERIVANIRAIDYVLRRNIPGAVVECGIWRGGSTMAMALASVEHPRDLWMYDTFSGMTDPTEVDIDFRGKSASIRMREDARKDRSVRGSVHCFASLEDVRANMQSTGYPTEMLRFIEGPVEKTIPENLPETIALMRIDTDWYESTRHELEHLFPRLVPGGVLIIDDYGSWKGSKKAVDEFFHGELLLNRIDSTGVVAVKQDRGHSC
jgi:hypothetical protein